jgi:hypothetical protein
MDVTAPAPGFKTVQDRARDQADAQTGVFLLVLGFCGQLLAALNLGTGIGAADVWLVTVLLIITAVVAWWQYRKRKVRRWLLREIALRGHAGQILELTHEFEWYSDVEGYDIDMCEHYFGADFLDKARAINPAFDQGVTEERRAQERDRQRAMNTE